MPVRSSAAAAIALLFTSLAIPAALAADKHDSGSSGSQQASSSSNSDHSSSGGGADHSSFGAGDNRGSSFGSDGRGSSFGSNDRASGGDRTAAATQDNGSGSIGQSNQGAPVSGGDRVSSATSRGPFFNESGRGNNDRTPSSSRTGHGSSVTDNNGDSSIGDDGRGQHLVPPLPRPGSNTTLTTNGNHPISPNGKDDRHHRRIYHWTGKGWATENGDSGNVDIFYDYGGGYYFNLGDIADTQLAVDAYLASLPASARRSVVDECRAYLARPTTVVSPYTLPFCRLAVRAYPNL